ncbi:MAG: hypothetical protein K8L97_25230, partial [Anaerolineae bacterium]|nr:hypothetical protein [Anaerolineae bacterium]
LASIEADICNTLSINSEARLIEPEQKYRELALAKYGILNLDFAVPESWLMGSHQTGIDLLRELGFNAPISENEDAGINEIIDNLAQPHLETLVEQLSKHQTYMLIILDAVGEHQLRLKLPDDYFPRTFIVRDACVTNAQSIWLTKHVYL